MIFEQRCLSRRCRGGPQTRQRIETEMRARQAVVAVNFPDALRMVLRKKLLIGDCSMDSAARLLACIAGRWIAACSRTGCITANCSRACRRPRTAVAHRHENAGTARRRGTPILERRQFRHRIPALDGCEPSEYRRRTPAPAASAER